MNLGLRRARRTPTEAEQIILVELRRSKRQEAERWTARKIGFAAFWMFVAGSAYYVAFQILVGFGLGVWLAAFIGGIVFTGVVVFAGRYEPR